MTMPVIVARECIAAAAIGAWLMLNELAFPLLGSSQLDTAALAKGQDDAERGYHHHYSQDYRCPQRGQHPPPGPIDYISQLQGDEDETEDAEEREGSCSLVH